MASPPPRSHSRPRPRIVLFGDSLTELGFGQAGSVPGTEGMGWASLLACRYSRRADVLVRGYSGYTTRHALGVLPSVLADVSPGVGAGQGPPPLLYAVFLGANDAAHPGMRQHVPVAEYGTNLGKIVDAIRRHHHHLPRRGCTIVLITPPPGDDGAWAAWCARNGRDRSVRTSASAREYGRRCSALAEELGVPVLDAWVALGGEDGPAGGGGGFAQHLTDGLHLSPSGNAALCDALMGLIEESLPELVPERVPLEHEPWTELC